MNKTETALAILLAIVFGPPAVGFAAFLAILSVGAIIAYPLESMAFIAGATGAALLLYAHVEG